MVNIPKMFLFNSLLHLQDPGAAWAKSGTRNDLLASPRQTQTHNKDIKIDIVNPWTGVYMDSYDIDEKARIIDLMLMIQAKSSNKVLPINQQLMKQNATDVLDMNTKISDIFEEDEERILALIVVNNVFLDQDSGDDRVTFLDRDRLDILIKSAKNILSAYMKNIHPNTSFLKEFNNLYNILKETEKRGLISSSENKIQNFVTVSDAVSINIGYFDFIGEFYFTNSDVDADKKVFYDNKVQIDTGKVKLQHTGPNGHEYTWEVFKNEMQEVVRLITKLLRSEGGREINLD